MYKFHYVFAQMDQRTGFVTSFEGSAIAENAPMLASSLYCDCMTIVSLTTEALYKVFDAPNNDTLILKQERI